MEKDISLMLPSELIRFALSDLKKAEKDKKVNIDMDIWYQRSAETKEDSLCTVCLAGAVMHYSLKDIKGKYQLFPEFYSRKFLFTLYALDKFRQGFVGDAFEILNLGGEAPFNNLCVPAYSENPVGFHIAMEYMADRLDEEGY